MSLLTHDVVDAVAVLRINDPRRRNIISLPLVTELEEALDRIEADPRMRAVVVTGEPPAFCAGADLADLEAASNGDGAGLQRIYQGFLRVANCSLPTIAAVNGPAVGAGMNLALACDIRMAGESAVFDTRFMNLGLHPGGGHTWMLQRAVGYQSACAILLCSESLDGRAAAERNLAWQCVHDEDLLEQSVALAQRAGKVPLELLRRTKESLRASSAGQGHAESVEHEYQQQLWSVQQEEFQNFLTKMKQRISGQGKKT
ncbi:MAG: enoyl-CoA hydratase [Chromatiales bacterium]|jgi:enoyl-CoA hydratase|nr:enoyl-CoA hydratase [Chromatiales bacterium]HJP03749.1 enoyl-CoA hydratase [Gammaproteobacteria bacterium]